MGGYIFLPFSALNLPPSLMTAMSCQPQMALQEPVSNLFEYQNVIIVIIIMKTGIFNNADSARPVVFRTALSPGTPRSRGAYQIIAQSALHH